MFLSKSQKRSVAHVSNPKRQTFHIQPYNYQETTTCTLLGNKRILKKLCFMLMLSLCMTCVTKTMWPRWNFNFGIIQACLHLTFKWQFSPEHNGYIRTKGQIKSLIGFFSFSSHPCICTETEPTTDWQKKKQQIGSKSFFLIILESPLIDNTLPVLI